MLRCKSEYRTFYDSARAKLAVSRPGWPQKRCHLTALRKMEKTFLRDLWLASAQAVVETTTVSTAKVIDKGSGDINHFVTGGEVVAVEVYQDLNTPGQYMRAEPCTTIVLWTRFKIRS